MDVILKGIIVYLKMIDKSILLFFLVSYASGCLMLGLTLDKTLDVASLQAAELAMHNEKRAIYGSSAISLDAALNTAAQAYADYLATNNLFAHSSQAQSGSYGENLYKGWGSPTFTYVPGAASLNWYNEVQYYNYNTFVSNDPSKAVGHFTAMVWRAVTKVGFGFAKVKDNGESYYVVANYLPVPNVQGQYAANVVAPQ